MRIREGLKVGDFFFYLITTPCNIVNIGGNLAALGSPHGIGWEFKEWTKLTMEPSRITKELQPMDPFKLEVLKGYKATGNITPTPIHIQLNELKKSFF